jgi:hypothetical protein
MRLQLSSIRYNLHRASSVSFWWGDSSGIRWSSTAPLSSLSSSFSLESLICSNSHFPVWSLWLSSWFPAEVASIQFFGPTLHSYPLHHRESTLLCLVGADQRRSLSFHHILSMRCRNVPHILSSFSSQPTSRLHRLLIAWSWWRWRNFRWGQLMCKWGRYWFRDILEILFMMIDYF